MRSALEPHPGAYERIDSPERARARVWVAPSARRTLLEAGLDDPDRALGAATVERWVGGGRTPHPVLRCGGEAWIIKSYRRGGLVARLNRDVYFGDGRFLRELAVCDLARGAGVPTVRPVALILERHWSGGRRAWLVVPFVESAVSLSDFLAPPPGATPPLEGIDPAALGRAAGAAVARMHAAGIDHRDLNLGNLLAIPGDNEPGGEGMRVAIVDWDRARARGAPGAWAFGNLLRLYRSALKLRADPARLGACLHGFLRGYFRTAPDGRVNPAPASAVGDAGGLTGLRGVRRLRAYARRRGPAAIFLHRLFWKRPEGGEVERGAEGVGVVR